jgi:hypothetical protein
MHGSTPLSQFERRTRGTPVPRALIVDPHDARLRQTESEEVVLKLNAAWLRMKSIAAASVLLD